MAKRKAVLNAALKALLAGLETSVYVKIPATFISEIASLPKDKREALDAASAEKFGELLTQAELSTTNAALAAVGTEQIKLLVANLTRSSKEHLDALTELTQAQYEETLSELHAIRANTEEIKADVKELIKKVDRANVAEYPKPADSIKYIPYPSNYYFTGRGEYLKQIRKALQKPAPTIITQAVSGLGGIGKTQLALYYAYDNKNNFDSIILLRADTDQTIASDIRTVLSDLAIPVADDETNTHNFHNWLTTNSNWLLIFDNADAPETIRPYIPPAGTGRILITSRASNFKSLGNVKTIIVKKMPENQALDFIYKRTKLKKTDTRTESSKQLAKTLDYLPLAIDQAAAYVANLNIDISDYLAEFNDKGAELFAETLAATSTGYDKSVATTWLMNFEQIKEDSTASADLLNLAAFLHPDEIACRLFTESPDLLTKSIKALFADSANENLALAKLLQPLTRFSLITTDKQTNSFSIHRLVQQIIRDTFSEDTRVQYLEIIIAALDSLFPDPEDITTWPLCAALAPHVIAVLAHAKPDAIQSQHFSHLLNETAIYLKNQAQYNQAEPLYKHSLEIDEASFGPDHLKVAIRLNNLAQLYQATNRLDQAEPLMKRALKIDEASYGPDHPKVATRLNNLAQLYKATNRLDKAEPLMKRVVGIFEKSLGKNHPNVATALNNLAQLYQDTNRLDEAEPLMKRALKIDEASFGPDHPNVATDLNNLAQLYQATSRLTEARPMMRRALKIFHDSLGPDHPDTITAKENLEAISP